jgi:hypothetical protein
MVLRPIIKGWLGELQSKITHKLLLDSEIYHTYNNVIIEDELGSTQIDHIIVSKFGVFVVETKDMDGWIFGSEKEKQWTQTFPRYKSKFQNPLHQNYRHTKTLSAYLGIEHEKLIPVVVFWGNCVFKTPVPDGVVLAVFSGDTKYIKSFQNEILTEEEVTGICENIQAAKDGMKLFSGFRHVQDLKERYESKITCPKCGGALVERDGSRVKFFGCSNYPRCKYTRGMEE